MKKLLLSTAIVGAVAFAPAANAAADLQVNLGGFLDFQAGYTSDDVVDDADVAAHEGDNNINFGNDTEISVSVTGKADNGLEYGAVIELKADIDDGDTDAGGVEADKTYAFVQGGWGRVEMGGNTGAEEALSVNTSTFASATGGVDGDFYRFTVTPSAFTGITSPDLALSHGGAAGTLNSETTDEDATKLTYYSPRFSGFQLGVSYIPNSDGVGVAAPSEAGFQDIFTGGVNYSGEFSGVGVKAAITGLTGEDDESGSVKDIEGRDVGANVSFSGFTVGGSYGDWQDSFGTSIDADYFDVGLGYAQGPWSASVTYMESDVDSSTAADRADFENLVIGADYQLAPGLVPYAEVSFFEYDDGAGTTAGTNDNEGTVVIIGSELTF